MTLLYGKQPYSEVHYNEVELYEPPHQKTNNMHMPKQRRRPASRILLGPALQ